MSQSYGVIVGTVKEVADPEGEGRVRVEFPWLGGRNQSYWAPVATLMSGANRGSWYMPEIGDEVLIAFDRGDVNHPYIVGFLWNGQDRPPTTDPQRRLIRSRNGHEIEMYDPDIKDGDKGYLRFTDAHGNVVELGNAHITIHCVGTLDIRAPNVYINGRVVSLAASPM